MDIGVTLLFKENDRNIIKGVLKSTVIDANTETFIDAAKELGSQIAKYYDYKYLGINDLFTVSGKVENGEILGRATFYELDELDKSETLTSNNNYSFNTKTELNSFNTSLVFFCENNDNEKFTITVLSKFDSKNNEVLLDANKLGNNALFHEKIKTTSVEEIENIKFIGVEDICDIDLKFDVFQSLYSEFDDIEILEDELLLEDELKELIEDIIEY